MMDRVYLIFELLAFMFCMYGMYGQKFQWNIYTVLCLGIEVMLYQVLYTYGQIKYFELIVYSMMFLYLLIQFKEKWKKAFISYIFCALITAVLQLVCYLPIMIWPEKLFQHRSIYVNFFLMSLMYILYKSRVLNKVGNFMKQKGRIIFIFLFTTLIFVFCSKYILHIYKQLSLLDYVILILSIALLFAIIMLLQKERMINREMKIEKELNQLYGNALAELIERVKVNQHNYRNQLVAIQGMVFTAENLEDLKKEQQKYYNGIQQEEQYSKLISGNNDPVIAGFLYSKLCNVDTGCMKIECSLQMRKKENSLFLSDIIQIVGVLIDNAIEEVNQEKYINKGIFIKILEEEKICIEVSNVCRKIRMDEMSNFFKKGISTKGQGRGLGLYSVKEMVKKWNGEIIPKNVDIEGENWFSISIFFPKPKDNRSTGINFNK